MIYVEVLISEVYVSKDLNTFLRPYERCLSSAPRVHKFDRLPVKKPIVIDNLCNCRHLKKLDFRKIILNFNILQYYGVNGISFAL
jgi:hypothetical protein